PLRDLLDKIAPGEYNLKCSRGNEVKVQVKKPDHYRAVMKELKERKTDLHSYQFKSERCFRVVLKNLHHTTDLDDIKKEFSTLGHDVKHVVNIRDRATKVPLPMFYIDLTKAPNNQHIYGIKLFMNFVITVEPPHKKREIPQCGNCQRYNHTKSFCHRAPRCVKCQGNHVSQNCPRKERDSNVICVNCGENHPANYKGCRVHKELQKKLFPKLREKRQARTGQEIHSFRKPDQTYADLMRDN
uniref:Pre-C2HC domain-containing protein n=1 Tax=Phlebotomus papatasi TaxID=29031 RepID=A0A1B0DDH5_PHLPP